MLLSRLVCVQLLCLFPFSCMAIFSIWSLQAVACHIFTSCPFSGILSTFALPFRPSIHPSIHPLECPNELITLSPPLPSAGDCPFLITSLFPLPSISQSIFISLISARLHLLVTFPYFQLTSYTSSLGMFSLSVHSSRNVSMCHWHLLQLQTNPPLSICLSFHSQFIKLTVPWRSLLQFRIKLSSDLSLSSLPLTLCGCAVRLNAAIVE